MTHEILEQCDYMIKMKEEYFQQLEEFVAENLKKVFPHMIFCFTRLENRLVWWESITVINFWGDYKERDIEDIFVGHIRAHKVVSGVWK